MVPSLAASQQLSVVGQPQSSVLKKRIHVIPEEGLRKKIIEG